MKHTLLINFNNAEADMKESKLALTHEDDSLDIMTADEVISILVAMLVTVLEDSQHAGAHIQHSKEN